MTTHIAHFCAKHKIIQIEQNSIFTWKQESGEIDVELLKDKILRENTVHFFRLVAGKNYPVSSDDIVIKILKAEPFDG
ncbi:GTP-binding protein LepA [Costertonia aggregata]|uniref:GTP-binding protein LepA n=1 Tax=Costertonia aggregata TaxID=343403 RepID=A0A7H9APN3_9FLAO|nr:GTP-binding protein LepA [Costertonia aggregata]QLG45386.1 GTP-binding protein LepA [Costertonia aggregata]